MMDALRHANRPLSTALCEQVACQRSRTNENVLLVEQVRHVIVGDTRPSSIDVVEKLCGTAFVELVIRDDLTRT